MPSSLPSTSTTAVAVQTPLFKVRIRPADPGWPRPMHTWRWEGCTRTPELPEKLPVPWINGPCVEQHGDWHSFRENGLEEMQARRLCLICGVPVEGPIYLPAQSHPEDRVTSGGGGHARCVLLSVMRCPHMVEKDYQPDDVIGWRYDGPGLGFGPDDLECHGDCDSVDPGATEITLADLKAAAHGSI